MIKQKEWTGSRNEFNIRLWTYAYIVKDPKVTSEGEGEGGG